jgi:hypothetical protein
VENGRVLVYCAVETGNNISEAITSINQKNSSLSGTEYDETSECLHSGEMWALSASFMNCISGFIVF